jgi:hypothetical protein
LIDVFEKERAGRQRNRSQRQVCAASGSRGTLETPPALRGQDSQDDKSYDSSSLPKMALPYVTD